MPEFKPPFPALTPLQRLHLEIYGYVVIEGAISPDLVRRLVEKTYEIEAEFRRTGTFKYGSKAMWGSTGDLFRLDNLPHVDDSYLEYVTHPYIVGMAHEVIGGEIRLEQSDVHLRKPVGEKRYHDFHRGASTGMAWQGPTGLYQCQFVKALTNLTDLGPDDGGTTVIAGSHKLTQLPVADIVKSAGDDPRLIHSVIAPAGSTLLFFETLIHKAGVIKSNKDRVLIVAGYAPAMFQPERGYDPEPELLERVPKELHPLLAGTNRYQDWLQDRRTRNLIDPAEPIALKKSGN